MTSIESLEPASVWRYFAGIAAVPRPSKREQRIREHVLSVAKQLALSARQDATGNVVVQVPASPGCEKAPVIVLQAHLDMVCEKNSDSSHDFERDPIRLVLDTEAAGNGGGSTPIVRADGTTLGADNGIGVAMALASASDKSVTHGPLELLFTVDEEAGMSGVRGLDPQFVHGRRLLNLDSEEDDVLYIGCAGGCDVVLTWELPTAPLPAGGETVRVSVGGLRGGHSGADIHLNRANAVKLLTQTLIAPDAADLRLVDMGGGRLRNAIPREAWAVVAGPAGLGDALTAVARTIREVAVREHRDEQCNIQVDAVAADLRVGRSQADRSLKCSRGLSPADTRRLLRALTALPHGVLAVVPEIAGLVQSSNNVASIEAAPLSGSDGLRITAACLARSSAAGQMRVVVSQIRAAAELAGASVQTGNEYPGWQPDLESPTLGVCRRVYERLFGAPPRMTAIHAGLECGLLGGRIPGMDMVSLGPRIKGAHSPEERVYVNSVQKSWRLLTAVLAELARA